MVNMSIAGLATDDFEIYWFDRFSEFHQISNCYKWGKRRPGENKEKVAKTDFYVWSVFQVCGFDKARLIQLIPLIKKELKKRAGARL